MLKFKARYSNQTIALADGTLIDRNSIGRDSVQAKLASNPSFAYMFEEVATAEYTTPPAQPVTGGGGAGDPRPINTRSRTKKA